ncbi:MAG: hypothetical protein WD735_00165, partial [Balneolaceae bacterium]
MSRFSFLVSSLLILLTYTATAQTDQQSYQVQIQDGIDLFEKGLYAEALPYFERAKEQLGSEIHAETAHFFWVRTLTRIDSAATDHYVDRFVQTNPTSHRSSRLLREVADQHLKRGELQDAILRMDEAL